MKTSSTSKKMVALNYSSFKRMAAHKRIPALRSLKILHLHAGRAPQAVAPRAIRQIDQ
jgi:hypothetical protein